MGKIARKGTTLTELMVAMTILTIGVVSMMGTFKYINYAMLSSRLKTIATNLAQEKMEVLKNKSYAQVLVTTYSLTSSGYNPDFIYDGGNYPPEVFTLWGMPPFTRAVNVDYASASDVGVSTLPYTANDTGMKKISVYVYWTERGTPKKVQLDSYHGNPSVSVLSTGFRGVVSSGGVPFRDALVQVVGAPRWRGYSDTDGNYSFQVAPGTYTLVCSSAGYYSQITPSSLNVVEGAYTTNNFSLVAIATGTVGSTSLYTPNINLIITQVVASTTMVSGVNIEYIELFNGTTLPINIGDNGGNIMKLSYLGEAGASQDVSEFNLSYISTWVAPGKFYLITNSSPLTINGSSPVPDAVYGSGTAAPCSWSGAAWSCIHAGKAGAIILKNASGNVVDKLGWSHTNASKPAPDAMGAAYPLNDGLESEKALIRMSDPCSLSSNIGRAYNSLDNHSNFMYLSLTYPPYSTLSGTKTIYSGIPATGAYIYANDDNSASVRSFDYGWCKISSFTLAGVSTGTWKVTVISGNNKQEVSNVAVTQNNTTLITNATTVPPYISAGYNTVSCTDTYVGGFVSGYVYGADSEYSVRLPNKIVGSDDGRTTTTDSQGFYMLNTPTGTVVVTANYNSADGNYMPSNYTAEVTQGAVSSLPDFHLSKGGFIKGYVTSGTSALPNIVIQATNGGAALQDVSDNTGYFYIFVSTSYLPYTISAELDPLQDYTSAPTSPLTATLSTAGSTVFAGTVTVIGAMGTITGTVTKSGSPITTGVLVVASTAAISNPPPTIDASVSEAQSTYYSASSRADGTYSLEVRGSAATYNMAAFYPVVDVNTGAVSYTAKTRTEITVGAGATVSGQDFTWP